MWMTAIIILALWCALTIWAEIPKGANKHWEYGNSNADNKALIVYNPDLFYNLDEQICKAFAEVLAENNIHAVVTTTKASKKINTLDYNTYIICTNTYNWQPDWPTTRFIKNNNLTNKKSCLLSLLAQAQQKQLNKHWIKKSITPVQILLTQKRYGY